MQSQTKRHIRMWHSSRSRAYLAPSPVCSSDWVQMLMHWQLQVLHSQCLVLIAIKPWHTRQFIRIQSIFWAWPWHGQCFTKHKCAAVGRGSIIFNHVQSLLGFGTCTRATGMLMQLRYGVGHFCSYCRPQQSQVLVPRKPTLFNLIC